MLAGSKKKNDNNNNRYSAKTLRQRLSSILNVQNGRLGLRSAGMLASSAYLASAAATLPYRTPFWQTHAPQLQIQQSVRLLPYG